MEEMAKNNSALQEQVKEMAKNNIALQRRMTQLETDLEGESEENCQVWKEVRRNLDATWWLGTIHEKFNLEIHGIPETDDEEPKDIVIGLAKLMEIDLTY